MPPVWSIPHHDKPVVVRLEAPALRRKVLGGDQRVHRAAAPASPPPRPEAPRRSSSSTGKTTASSASKSSTLAPACTRPSRGSRNPRITQHPLDERSRSAWLREEQWAQGLGSANRDAQGIAIRRRVSACNRRTGRQRQKRAARGSRSAETEAQISPFRWPKLIVAKVPAAAWRSSPTSATSGSPSSNPAPKQPDLISTRNLPGAPTLPPGRHPLCSQLISIMDGGSSEGGTAGAGNGSQRIQTIPDPLRPARIICAGESLPDRLGPTVPDFLKLHGMQKVRGSNPLSSTGFPDLCSIIKTLTKTLTGLGFFVALVRIVFVVVEDAVHHGRSPADRGHDHVAVDGLGDVGGLVAHSVADRRPCTRPDLTGCAS
jgi:hypothetical protein